MSRFAALALCVAFFSFASRALAPLCAAEPQQENPFDAPSDLYKPPTAAAQVDDPTPRLEAKIRQALREPTVMEFTETPLQDVASYLKDKHQIEIQLDSKALEDESVGSDSPITRSVAGISLAAGLNLVLRDLELTYVVRDGVLLITTDDAARRMLELRVYSVSDLVKSEADADRLVGILQSVLSSETDSLPTRAEKAEVNKAQPPRLAVVPFRNVLLVKASQHDHAQIASLLGEIRAKLQANPGQ